MKAKKVWGYLRHFDLFLGFAGPGAVLIFHSSPKLRIVGWTLCVCSVFMFAAECFAVCSDREKERQEAGTNSEPE